MRIAIRSLALIGSLSIVLTAGSMSLTAQESKQQETSKDAGQGPPAAKKNDPSRRVPPYFGQIGLRPEQREEIYKIRAKHSKKIDELQAKIDAIRAEMMTECEGILDPTQKQVLAARRKSGANSDGGPATAPKE